MCSTGKVFSLALHMLGCKATALIPLTSTNIWSQFAQPAVTYGCQLWKINATNMSELEITQKYVAKPIQSFPVRTHGEIARGMIGLRTPWNLS